MKKKIKKNVNGAKTRNTLVTSENSTGRRSLNAQKLSNDDSRACSPRQSFTRTIWKKTAKGNGNGRSKKNGRVRDERTSGSNTAEIASVRQIVVQNPGDEIVISIRRPTCAMIEPHQLDGEERESETADGRRVKDVVGSTRKLNICLTICCDDVACNGAAVAAKDDDDDDGDNDDASDETYAGSAAVNSPIGSSSPTVNHTGTDHINFPSTQHADPRATVPAFLESAAKDSQHQRFSKASQMDSAFPMCMNSTTIPRSLTVNHAVADDIIFPSLEQTETCQTVPKCLESIAESSQHQSPNASQIQFEFPAYNPPEPCDKTPSSATEPPDEPCNKNQRNHNHMPPDPASSVALADASHCLREFSIKHDERIRVHLQPEPGDKKESEGDPERRTKQLESGVTSTAEKAVSARLSSGSGKLTSPQLSHAKTF